MNREFAAKKGKKIKMARKIATDLFLVYGDLVEKIFESQKTDGNGNRVKLNFDLEEVHTQLWKACRKKVKKMKPWSLGVLAYQDTERGHLYGVHNGTWLGKQDSGRQCLRQMAATALVAELYSMQEEKMKGEKQKETKVLVTTT